MTRPHALYDTTECAALSTLWTLRCQTTGRIFTTDEAVVYAFDDMIAVQAHCAYCNAVDQCPGDAGYDPAVPPQVHAAVFRVPDPTAQRYVPAAGALRRAWDLRAGAALIKFFTPKS